MAQTKQPNTVAGRVEPIRQPPKHRLPFPLSLYQSAVGKKWVMALTGIALLGFVLVHMIGNLHIYEGPVQVNDYAEALRGLGGDLLPRTLALWLLRIGLIGAFALHIHSAYGLTRMNLAANEKYASKRDYVAADFASRTMRWTGIIVLLFLIWHLADLTWGTANAVGTDGPFVRGDAYANVVRSLERWPVSLFYIFANIALGIHLFHGTWSLFQSLGLNNPRFNKWRQYLAAGVATIVVVGNVSVPVAVLAGVVG